MSAIKVGVREFRERIASFLESDTPVAVTRRGETLGVYVPTRRKQPKTADLSELKAAADRLAEALADVDEEEFVADFKQLRRRGKQLIETYGSRGARFFTPDVAFGDAATYLPSLLEKRGKQDVDVPVSLQY